MPLAITCSNVYPDCAFTIAADAGASGAGLSATVNSYLDHCDQKHNAQHPGPQSAGRKAAFIFT